MIKLLIKIFIKDSTNINSPTVRQSYALLSGVLGIILNFLLFGVKFTAGLLSCSISIKADSFNNLSDMIGSIITIIGFSMAKKTADKHHPYGHGRMEYVAGLGVSFLILTFSYQLFVSSVQSFFNKTPITPSLVTLATLILSIIVKLYMYLYNSYIAKRINSPTMQAAAKDSVSDILTTSIVLIALLLTKFYPSLSFPFDSVAGVAVSLFIFYNGITSAKETIDPLLGGPLDKEYCNGIINYILGYSPLIEGVHDCMFQDYGPGNIIASIHAEVDGNKDIFNIHEVIDDIEKEVNKRYGCLLTIHMDPIDKNNTEREPLINYLKEKLASIDENINIHDLRIVPGGSHTNIIFDVVPSAKCTLKDEDLKKTLEGYIKEYNSKYNAVIHIDSPFFNH